MQKRALTVRGNGRLPAIICEVGVSVPFLGDPSTQKDLLIKPFSGVWDTGATNSVITKNVVDALKLKPTGQTEVHTASGTSFANTYLINMYLPSNVFIPNLRVTQGELKGIDMLIGMDIITIGDFSITNFNGKTVMSFRFPSCEEIDYIPQADKDNKMEIMAGMNRHQRRAFEAKNNKH